MISFTRQLGELTPVTEIILFGSRARGDHRKDSDVDLLVLLREPNKDDLAHLHWLEKDFNRKADISVQLLGVPEARVKRELRSGNLPLYDAMVEGIALYPEVGTPPRRRSEASLFSLKAAAAQWLTVAEDSWAGAIQGNERVPASHPMAQYARGYYPAQASRLAVAAVRSAMWTAYYLRGERPDRAAALDTMARDLSWPTEPLTELLVPTDRSDEPTARAVTEIAGSYMELIRKLAVETNVSVKRISHDAISAYRSILEKHKSHLAG